MLTLNYLDIHGYYNISKSQKEEYKKNGFIKLKNLLQESTLETIEQRVSSIVKGLDKKGKISKDYNNSHRKESLLVKNVWEIDPLIKSFTFSSKLSKIAANLLGVNCVRLLNDYAIYKEPGDRPTGWHQDSNYIPLDTKNVITAWIPLHEFPPEIGSLNFLIGSHKLNDPEAGDYTNMKTALKQDLLSYTYGLLALGDVTFHSGWSIHSAQENKTNITRKAFAITYFENGASVSIPKNFTGQKDRYFPGLQDGEIVNGDSYPLLV